MSSLIQFIAASVRTLYSSLKNRFSLKQHNTLLWHLEKNWIITTGSLGHKVYRKPMHTDRYLHKLSNPMQRRSEPWYPDKKLWLLNKCSRRVTQAREVWRAFQLSQCHRKQLLRSLALHSQVDGPHWQTAESAGHEDHLQADQEDTSERRKRYTFVMRWGVHRHYEAQRLYPHWLTQPLLLLEAARECWGGQACTLMLIIAFSSRRPRSCPWLVATTFGCIWSLWRSSSMVLSLWIGE